MPAVTVAGSIAQRPGHGGHAWAFLQYLLGFRALGYDVLFIDRLTPEMATDARGRPSPASWATGARWLNSVMEAGGCAGDYSLLADDGTPAAGIARAEIVERVQDSILLLNVMGFLDDEEILEAASRRVFLDIDPGFGQMWKELELADVFAGHDDFVTIAENMGRPECGIPECGLRWLTTRMPVVLDEWPAAGNGSRFTSVVAWRGPYEPVEYAGRRYGLRAHEFRKFVDLPRLTGERFEIAVDIDGADSADLELLRENGWDIVDPALAAGDPGRYRQFIGASAGELMVAKEMYVATRSGWFSDRSACYLASGKPVLAQDTGFSQHLPAGEGLIAFSDPEEAAEGVRSIRENLPAHSRAARALAESHFEAGVVLGRLLEELEIG